MRVPLLSGAYSAPGFIANAQRSVNLFPEGNPDETRAPVPVTQYARPGLTLLNPCPSPGRGRGLYRATNGDLYAVVDTGVYYIDPDWSFHLLGNMQNPGNTPVSLADNGTSALIVDGSLSANAIDLGTHAFTQIGDPNFLGADRLDFLDSFLIMNEPDTTTWYCTLADQLVWNALDFGTKSAWPDNIVTVIAVHRQVWVLGSLKSEVWYNAGNAAGGFPFQLMPGNIVEHGCAAKYSVAKQDVDVFWLSESPEGARMVMRGGPELSAERISNHAIEAEFLTYPRVDDAIGATYQQRGHAFYKLHFPTADKTWVFDRATGQWHQRAYSDTNGVLHRERDSFCAYAHGTNVALDWSNGSLYAMDEGQLVDQIMPGSLTPANQSIVAPVVCIRAFPHLVGDKFQRVSYNSFIADIQSGTASGTTSSAITVSPWSSEFSSEFGPQTQVQPPQISLRFSRTRGASWLNARIKPLGAAGKYNTTPNWWQFGIARDGVFELNWQAQHAKALNGAFVEFEPAET